jgi:hypothetical protein
MYLSFWGVTRKELATQIFLCAPKSDFLGVKKNSVDGYGSTKTNMVVMIAMEMYMV